MFLLRQASTNSEAFERTSNVFRRKFQEQCCFYEQYGSKNQPKSTLIIASIKHRTNHIIAKGKLQPKLPTLCVSLQTDFYQRSSNLSSNIILRKLENLTAQHPQNMISYHPDSKKLMVRAVTTCSPCWSNQLPEVFRQIVCENYKIIDEITGSYKQNVQKPNQQYETDFNILNLKKYIQASNKYAWKTISATTGKSSQNLYTLRKKLYRNIKPYKSSNSDNSHLQRCLYKIYCDLFQPQRMNMFHLTSLEDTAVYEAFLEPIQTNKNEGKLLTKIDLNVEEAGQLQARGKIRTLQRILEKVDRSQDLLKRQQAVFQLLPNEGINGLLSYFLASTNNSCTKLLKESSFSCNYNDFLVRFKKVLSLKTILSILSQIAQTLIRIRNCRIAYNNLTPKNILVGQNLKVLLTNFTNAYSKELEQMNLGYQPAARPPYVMFETDQNYPECFMSETNDVFSLGVLLYRSLMGKTPHNNKLNQPDLSYRFSKPKFCIESCKEFIFRQVQLLICLSLKACKPFQPQNDLTGSVKPEDKLLATRPFLDWMCIITSYLNAYYRQ